MMLRRARCLLVTIAAGMAIAPAYAGEIVLEDARCKTVKPEDLAALQAKLRTAKAIGADDTITCKVGSDTRVIERNFNVTDIFHWIGGSACREVNSRNRAACADKTDASEQAQCEADEKARYAGVQSSCN